MTPDFAIWADGLLITRNIKAYLVSLRVTDEAGMKSDAIEIILDNRDGKLPLPNTGTYLKLSIGYAKTAKTTETTETTLTHLGVYVINEMVVESLPQRIIIKAHAADLNKALKSQQTRSWQPQTLGEIVNQIALQNGYKARMSVELSKLTLSHLDQSSESDMHFLTRLANLHGAIAKPAGGYLLFM